MGYGLGKNTPITLSQSRANFEALIGRHGQWTRWRTAKKCPCVNAGTGQSDIHCEKCGGAGYIYGWQKSALDEISAACRDGICDMGDGSESFVVEGARGADGRDLPFSQFGRFVAIDGAGQNEICALSAKEPLEVSAKNVDLTQVAGTLYEAADVLADASKIEGVWQRPPCDIVSAAGIFDADGIEYEASGFSQNRMTLARKDGEPIAAGASISAASVSYLKPVVVAILEQSAAKGDADFLAGLGGDAFCTFPYKYDISEGDALTVLAGARIRKEILQKREGDDVLPDDFVEKIESVETASAVWQNGNDYILAGANRIRWICENPPAKGAMLSVVWRAFPTYRVLKEMPNLRTSENQRQPRRAALKLLGAFQAARGLSKN